MSAMRYRKTIVGLVLSIAVAVGAWQTLQSVEDVDKAEAVQKDRFALAQKQHEETVGVVQKLAQKASSTEEWKEVIARANTLPTPLKEHFTQAGTIGMVESLGNERDRLFTNAGELFAANEKDAEVPKILEKAKVLQELADTYVQKITCDQKDTECRLTLNYRKAYEKYRSLAFLDPKENDKALDIIDEAMGYLRLANTASQKNPKVEVAMEFLYKRAKEEEGKKAAKSQAPGPPRALPSSRGDGRGPQDSRRF